MSYAKIKTAIVLEAIDAMLEFAKARIEKNEKEIEDNIEKRAQKLMSNSRWFRPKSIEAARKMIRTEVWRSPLDPPRQWFAITVASESIDRANRLRTLAKASSDGCLFLSLSDAHFLKINGG